MDASSPTEEIIITKFDVKNNPLYVKLLWKEDSNDYFDINIFYEENTWFGKYSNALAAERIKRLDETPEQYVRNVKHCLSADSNDYIYEFNKSPSDINSASFIWKKKYQDAVKIHGVVPVQQDEIPICKEKIIDILLEKNKNLISKVELAKETNNDLKQDIERYIQKLHELTESKILLESTLYGRFVQVLNEKKRRIQLLEDQLKSLKALQ